MADFPTAEEVDPSWLTATLNNNGFDCEVASFNSEQVGTGQIGKCIRYTLRYADERLGPTSLIGKFPSDDPDSRATGVMLNNFLKEVQFYRLLQSRLSIRTPRCYFADIDGVGPDFLLLLEDLAPAEQGDQLAGCEPDVALAAIRQLVGLHGPSWCDESLLGNDWLHNQDASPPDAMRALYNAQLPGFLDRYREHLSTPQQEIITALGEATQSPLYTQLNKPFSLVHVDYRLDNLLIEPTSSAPVVTVVDWQSITLGAPLNDVAYFLGAGLLPNVRRDVEHNIVQAYHQDLTASGVTDFSFDDCWQGYRRGSFAGFGVTVVASMLVQRTARGDKMFIAMAQRHAQHAIDLQAQEFLA